MAHKCKKCGNEKNYNFALNVGLCDICIGSELERIAGLEAELEKHRWIPVSERLPENIADVFILTGEGSGGIAMYGEDENGFGWERLDHAINLNITHWKPIF